MKTAVILATLIIVGTLSAPPRAQAAAANDADQAWAALNASARPKGLARAADGKAKAVEVIKAEIKQQAALLRQTSQNARAFYTSYPSHPKAADARKLEAITALQGVESGDIAQEQSALATGKAFRENVSHPLHDRFEVALAMDRLDLSLRIKSRRARGRPDDWKAIGDKLKSEFGDIAPVYSYYMDVAATADRETALRIATEVSRSSVASGTSKGRARVIIDREGLIGKPLTLKLTTIEGNYIDLAQHSTTATVILAWSPSDPSALALIKRFEKSIPTDVRIVYLAMGGTANEVRKGKDETLLPGTHCHAPSGPLARSANDGLKLQYSPLPRVYVLNKVGNLVGYGRIHELPALLVNMGG